VIDYYQQLHVKPGVSENRLFSAFRKQVWPLIGSTISDQQKAQLETCFVAFFVLHRKSRKFYDLLLFNKVSSEIAKAKHAKAVRLAEQQGVEATAVVLENTHVFKAYWRRSLVISGAVEIGASIFLFDAGNRAGLAILVLLFGVVSTTVASLQSISFMQGVGVSLLFTGLVLLWNALLAAGREHFFSTLSQLQKRSNRV
jgi:hypothetical protein